MATDSDNRLKPVVAFDVDGVLRIRRYEDFDQGLFPVEVTFEENQFPRLFHGKPQWDEHGKSYGLDHFSTVAAQYRKQSPSSSTACPQCSASSASLRTSRASMRRQISGRPRRSLAGRLSWHASRLAEFRADGSLRSPSPDHSGPQQQGKTLQ